MTEEACFVKMFKFFDQGNKGFVNFDEFDKVLEKTGMYYPKANIQQLFKHYDNDGSGQIDYR
jgi:Ca2+-binding EF-hand superfamily protein